MHASMQKFQAFLTLDVPGQFLPRGFNRERDASGGVVLPTFNLYFSGAFKNFKRDNLCDV